MGHDKFWLRLNVFPLFKNFLPLLRTCLNNFYEIDFEKKGWYPIHIWTKPICVNMFPHGNFSYMAQKVPWKKGKIQLFIPDFDNLRWYSFKILCMLKNIFSRVKMFCRTCSKTNSQTVPIHWQKYKIFPQGEIPTLTEKKSLQKSTENSVVHTHQITMVWHPFFLYYFWNMFNNVSSCLKKSFGM